MLINSIRDLDQPGAVFDQFQQFRCVIILDAVRRRIAQRPGHVGKPRLVEQAGEHPQGQPPRPPPEAGLKQLKAPCTPKELPVSALIRNAHGVVE